jgi:hypothetical protein
MSEPANNIIQFPVKRMSHKVDPLPTVVLSNIKQVDEVMGELFDNIFEFLAEKGYCLVSHGGEGIGRYDKDIVFMIEAAQSVLLKYHSIEHPFQRVAEQVLDVTPEGEFAFVLGDKKKTE